VSVLRILHLEDNALDAELLLTTLRDAEILCTAVRVDSKQDFVAALNRDAYDLIISDFSLPSFDGKSALEIARQRCPETPFIFVSGTLGEEAAVDMLLAGATDYVLKHRFSRLIPAVKRAQQSTQERALRLEAEARLASASAQLRNLFENLDDIFLSIDVQHIERSQVSPACERLFGWSVSDFVEQPGLWMNSFHPDDREIADEIVCSMSAGKAIRGDCRVIARSGRVHWLEFQLKPVTNAEGTLVRVDGGIRDATEHRTLERQFQRTQRLESIGTLASGIAHDLNNVLAPMLTGFQLLRDRTDDVRSLEMLKTLELSTVRGAELVRQVLTFARGIEEHRGLVPIQGVFSDIWRILKETLPRSITLSNDVPENLWAVRGDSTQLHQLLLNLCVNARDAMPGGGRLLLSAKNVRISEKRQFHGLELKPGTYIAIEVADTGQGMAPETLDQIFEPFYTTKPTGKGTGLGLFTVQAILRSHYGFIDISTKVGVGTVFTVYLPAQEIPESEPLVSPLRKELPVGNGELVLLVDDEAAVREIVSATLEAYGYHVITAVNGEDGLSLFKKRMNEIRVIFSDMNMPVMGGDVMIHEIRRISPHVGVVSASGLTPQSGHEHSPRDANTTHIQKPFTAYELLQAVKSVVSLTD
jgi:two-component system cell cycle sensor histidine kinase/response regulator CckA